MNQFTICNMKHVILQRIPIIPEIKLPSLQLVFLGWPVRTDNTEPRVWHSASFLALGQLLSSSDLSKWDSE